MRTNMLRSPTKALVVMLVLVLAGCGGDDVDDAITDTAPTDTAPTDSGPTDTAPTDSGPTDTASTDSGPTEPAATEQEAADTEPVTLTWVNWALSEESTRENAESLIAAFEAANPNVTIESVPVGFSDVPNQVITMTSAGTPPDIIQTEAGYTAQLAAEDLLAPLDDLATDDYMDRLLPEVVQAGRYQEKLYAIPWFAAPFGLWYNRDLMEQAGLDPETPPETLDDLTAAMEALREAVPDALPFGLDTTVRPFGLTHNWAPIRAHGAEPITADGEVAADTPEMQAYLTWVSTLIEDGLTQPSKKLGEFRNLAAQGDLLFAFDGPYLAGTMQSINPELTDELLQETWGVTSFPGMQAGEAFTVPTDHQLAITAASENQEVAWEFITFMAGDEQAIRDYVLPLGGLPPFADATATFEELDQPIAQAFYDDVIPTVEIPPLGPEYAEAAEVIMTNVQRIYAENADPASVAADMQTQLEAVYGG